MNRLVVVVPRAGRRRLTSGPGFDVVGEEDLVKCHSPAEVAHAIGEFVTLSPVALTATKPGYGPPLGIEGVRKAAGYGRPFYALGGVTPQNARSFLDAGAYGVAVLGPVMRADDPLAVVHEFLEAL